MGGYYAQYLGQRYDLPVVLINPALHPVPLLLEMAGEQENYYTGERYHLTENAVRDLAMYAVEHYAGNVLLLLDKGDEVIDYRDARDCYQDVGTVRAAEIINRPNNAQDRCPDSRRGRGRILWVM